MAVHVETKIAEALLARLAALVLSPPLPIAWPNLAFTPPAGAYLQADHLQAPTVNLFLSNADPDMHVGLLQVTVVAPLNQGVIGAVEIAGSIANHFGKGTALDHEGLRVRIEDRPSIAPALVDEDRLRVPVTVTYRVFA